MNQGSGRLKELGAVPGMYYSLLLSAVSVADRHLPPSLLEKEEEKAMADPDRAEGMLSSKHSAGLYQPLLRP